MSYKEKYLKYKTKYLNLQSQLGGTPPPQYYKDGKFIVILYEGKKLSIKYNNSAIQEETNFDYAIYYLINDIGLNSLSLQMDTVKINTFLVKLQEVQERNVLNKIKSISLSTNLIKDNSIDQIKNIFDLSIFPNLQKLDLVNCAIGDTQFIELAEILKKNDKLTYLNLANNNITNKGAQQIALMLQKEGLIKEGLIKEGLIIDLRFQTPIGRLSRYEPITEDTANLFNPTNILFKDVAVVTPYMEYGEEGKNFDAYKIPEKKKLIDKLKALFKKVN